MTTADEESRRGASAAGDTTARLAARIAARAAANFPGELLDSLLADRLAGSELNTVLLHALRRRAQARSLAEVREHAARQVMLQPSSADARRMHAFDAVAFRCAREFQALDLAPVEPLGTSACVGVDPNSVLATLRFAEVAGDPTTSLALHAAERRRHDRSGGLLKLCASQRVMRLQPVDQPAFSPHFRLFALATAARSGGSRPGDAVERSQVLDQLDVWARIFADLAAEGFAVAGTRVVLSDTRLVTACLARQGVDAPLLARGARAHRPEAAEALLAEAGVRLPRDTRDPVTALGELGLGEAERAQARGLMDEIAAPLRERHPDVDVSVDLARLEGLNYYVGPTVRMVVRRTDGLELSIGDGGALPWIRQLLSDRREHWVTSAVGTELMVKLVDRAAVAALDEAAS